MTGHDRSPTPDDASSSPIDGLKAEFDRAKGTLGEVKTELAAASEARRGGPAESVDEAETKADELRRAIDRDVAALRARVPDGDEVRGKARTTGLAIGGGIVGLGILVKLLGRRGARKAEAEEARARAAAIAAELVRLERARRGETEETSAAWLRWVLLGAAVAGAGALAWQRTRSDVGIDDVFGAPQDDPLRPADVTATTELEVADPAAGRHVTPDTPQAPTTDGTPGQ